MSEQHDNHGNSLAAWVAVGILLVAFAVMCLAVAFPNVPMFIGGVVLGIVGVIVGKVLAMAGYGADGKKPTKADAHRTEAAASRR